MRWALWVEIRRSPLRWWFPGFVALTLMMLFGRSREWIGVWPETSAAAQVPMVLLAPALAAGAAWSATRDARSGMREQVAMTARSRWVAEAVHLAAAGVFGVAAFGVGVLVAFSVTLRETGPGWVWPSYLVLGFLLVTLSVSFGYLSGKLYPRLTTPILVGVLAYVSLTFFRRTKLSMFVLSGSPTLDVSWPALLARTVLVATVIYAAVTIPAARSSFQRSRRSTAATATSVVLILSATLAVLSTGNLRHERAPVSPLCSGTAPRVCVWPEHEKYLAETVDMSRRLTTALEGVSEIPRTIYEHGVGPDQQAAIMIGRGLPMLAYSMASAFPFGSIYNCREDAPRDRAFEQVLVWRATRAIGGLQPLPMRPGEDASLLSEVATVLAKSDNDQKSWVRERLEVLSRPCTS